MPRRRKGRGGSHEATHQINAMPRSLCLKSRAHSTACVVIPPSRLALCTSRDAFLSRCRAFAAKPTTIPLKVEFSRLREGYSEFRRSRDEEARTASPDFNLFRVLRLEREEVRLHSALLAHLLDPRGTHGQGTLFLEAFWNRIGGDKGLVLTKPRTFARWRVSKEKFTIKGNLDLVLEDPQDGVLCVIENKVDAGEGREQLKRYRDWLALPDIQRRFSHRLLYFLTLDGRAAETLTDEEDYQCISYQDHIHWWLKEVTPHILSDKVKVIAAQYLETVELLSDAI